MKFDIPGSVELDEDILGLVEDDLLELLADDGVDALILGLRDGLALERRLQGSTDEPLNPVADNSLSGAEGLVERVLHLVLHALDNEGGPLDVRDVEGLSVLAELDSVDPDEVELGLELLGDGLDGINERLPVLLGRVDEEVCEGLGAVGVGTVVLAADLVDDGDGKVLQPILDLGNLEVRNGEGVLGSGLIEATVDNEGGGVDRSGRSDVLVGDDTEEEVITVLLGEGAELSSRGIGGRREVGDNNKLVSFDELGVVVLNLGDSGQRLPKKG